MPKRKATQWTICEDTGIQAIKGECPTHGGDACLIVVARVVRAVTPQGPQPRKRTMFKCSTKDCDFHTTMQNSACPRHPQAKLKKEAA